MFKSTKNDGRLAELEQAITDGTQALVDAKAAIRVTWDKVKDIRAALEDGPDSPALAAGLREADGRGRGRPRGPDAHALEHEMIRVIKDTLNEMAAPAVKDTY